MTAIEKAIELDRESLNNARIDFRDVINAYELAYAEEHARVEARDNLIDETVKMLRKSVDTAYSITLSDSEQVEWDIKITELCDRIDTQRKEGR